jgi:hypothetical protein
LYLLDIGCFYCECAAAMRAMNYALPLKKERLIHNGLSETVTT